MRVCAAVLVVLALVPGRAWGQEEEGTLPELVQELFQAEAAYPQEAGEIQLTVAARPQNARLLVEYGITDRLQVSAATPYLQLDQDSEEAWEAGVLYNLVNGPDRAVSVSLEVEIPTSGDGTAVSWEPALIAARRMGSVQLHGTLAASWSRDESELSPGVGLLLDAGRLTPTLELTAAMARGEAAEVALTPGIYLHLGRNLEFGIAKPLRLQGAPQAEVLALLTLEL